MAILGADTVVESAPALLLGGVGHDPKFLQDPSAGNAGEQPSVGYGATNPTGLSPRIRLLSGDVSPETEPGSAAVTTTSVSSADTGRTMRPDGGGTPATSGSRRGRGRGVHHPRQPLRSLRE